MLRHYGRESGMRVARKHIGWYSNGLPGSASFRAALNQEPDVDVARTRLATYYDRLIETGFRRPRAPGLECQDADRTAWAA